MERYVLLRYDHNDFDHIPDVITRIIMEFLISLTVGNESEFKGPYELVQVICNYLFKSDGVEFVVLYFHSYQP